MQPIYLDHAATTPLDPQVLEAMLPWLREHHGNPSSVHAFGREARVAVELARRQVSTLIGATPSEVVFCGSGTEANNLAILGVFAGIEVPCSLTTSAVEHSSVREPCALLERHGVRVGRIGVDLRGLVDPSSVATAVGEDTALVSVMLANNEVGTIQPVREISQALAPARHRGLLVHSDAVQALGKLAVRVDDLGVDLLSLSAHKLHGPKGVGALYVRTAVADRLAPRVVGGGQERGRRAGTENVAAIVGFGAACELAGERSDRARDHVASLQGRLLDRVRHAIPDMRLHGPKDSLDRLPGIISVGFPGVDGDSLLARLDLDGIAVSRGSACTSGTTGPSWVLSAMGLTEAQSRETIRISPAHTTTEDEIDLAVQALFRNVRAMRAGADHGR